MPPLPRAFSHRLGNESRDLSIRALDAVDGVKAVDAQHSRVIEFMGWERGMKMKRTRSVD